MKLIKLFILLSIFCSAARSQTGPAAFLPVNDDIPGWRQAGEPEIYKETNLFDVAKEDSKLVLEFGFNYAVSARYYNFTGTKIDVLVYTMNSSFGSYGLFLRAARGMETYKEFGNLSYRKDGEFGFWKHLYFIKMISAISGDTATDGFKQIAGFIDSKIRSKGQLPSILDFSKERRGDIVIFKGPLALSEIYYFSPLNIFFINEGMAIVTPEATELIFSYADNNEAVHRFSEVAGILSQMTKFSDFIMPVQFSFAMRDRDGKMLTFKVMENRIDVIIK